MDSERCPMCDKATVVAGHIPLHKAGAHRFEPTRFPTFRLWGQAPACSSDFRACLACGHVWTYLRPEDLRAFIEKHGDAETRRKLSQYQKVPLEQDLL
ncbi:hypothetical protein [Paludisphaera borealis]|uniref:Uncharacterized protein n=1 Tax=Paludisphaera borealis TaxID=1387353 RepID=A0A1U7CS88_9BACT|nr:hypothetical protein [Paludisphaera borealis]APW61759.1 hypothetical protein BSF38_03287 [Paludisphaera borealis]